MAQLMRNISLLMLYASKLVALTFLIFALGILVLQVRGHTPPAPMVSIGLFLAAVVISWHLISWPFSRAARRRAAASSEVIPMNGHDFEHWVADKLRQQGWRAQVTQGSGDQGIDVIATRSGKKVGIQCKRYVGSVGNKAVQEAFSGKAYHRVDIAAVITTGRYTQSARDLAGRTGVHLLEVRDIATMHRKLAV